MRSQMSSVSAKSWGYQYESMAVDLLVKVIERYLAEQRNLLQEDLKGVP